ncbi:MAG: hypothetical protein ACPGVZ_03625 [Myxococcota bacterium]
MSAEPGLRTGIGQDQSLTSRLERVHALCSACSVLAPAGVVGDEDEIGATGQALTEYLSALVDSHSDVSASALDGIDNLLGEFETSIRRVATCLPVARLRSALPSFGDEDRRGLLDLLDLLIAQGFSRAPGIGECIGAIDSLVTLLCTHGAQPGAVRFDPVTLTERLSHLCEAHDDPSDPRLAEIEGEFFAAANLDAEALREERLQRTLRQRKAELGALYFAPRMLRAIVTYNAALLARVDEGQLDSADWGDLSGEAPARETFAATSVFESAPLRDLAAAVVRRLAGETPEPTPTDRIAWALDLEYLADNERKALQGPGLATSKDPLGTAVLVGLLCRSVAVLGVDFQDAGLPPDHLTGAWVDELSKLFQEEINGHIEDDAYPVACALSELKNKFLLAPLAEHLREERAATQQEALPPSQPRRKPEASDGGPRENARDLVREALTAADEANTPSRLHLMNIPWARLSQSFALAAAIVVGVWLYLERDGDLDRLGRDQLVAVSPYLEAGRRDAAGTGRSFVGEIDEAWLALPRDERVAIAEQIIDRLRAAGMQQVMIFDDDDQVRIQALGSQPVRVL